MTEETDKGFSVLRLAVAVVLYLLAGLCAKFDMSAPFWLLAPLAIVAWIRFADDWN